MKRTGRKQEWSLTLFAFGGLVFLPPVIGLYDKPLLVMGLPVTYILMFGVWALIIAGIWHGARRSPLRDETLPPGGNESGEELFGVVEQPQDGKRS